MEIAGPSVGGSETSDKLPKNLNGKSRGASWLRIAAWCALAVLFFNILDIALNPFMPTADSGGSWIYAMNQAVAQKMVFGRDLIFTFGPYASVYTHAYHPATLQIMLFGCALLDLCYACGFAWLVRRANWSWRLILAALFVAPLITPDAFFLSFSLLQALVVFRMQGDETGDRRKPAAVLMIAMLFGCAGMLPLIKGSFAVSELGTCVVCLSFFALRRQWKLALACFLAPLIAMALFWAVVGQRLADLAGFFAGNFPIISGYTDAMSLFGAPWEALLFLFGALAILLAIARGRELRREQKAFLLAAYALYFFVAFKAGFGRQDITHVSHALGALALGSLSLMLLHAPQQKRFSRALCLIAYVAALLPFGASWHDVFVLRAESAAPGTYEHLKGWALLSRLRANMGDKSFLELAVATEPHLFAHHPWKYGLGSWREKFDDARREINASSQLKFVMPGRVDIYPFDQVALLSRGYDWDPRPVLQSYSAYTPKLIRSDAQHLRGPAAPQHIVFRLETIDGRLPSLDDGLSWPAMLDNYRVAEVANNWVHLVRKLGPLQTRSQFTLLETTSARLGQDVILPPGDGPIFGQIILKPTFYGRVVDFGWKLPQLHLTLVFDSNRQASYRVIAGMMQTDFLVSPLVTDNDGFVRLFDGSVPLRQADRVCRLRLDAEGGGWRSNYMINFRQYKH